MLIFRKGYALKNFNLIKFKMVNFRKVLKLICIIQCILETILDSWNINIKQTQKWDIREGCTLNVLYLIKFKVAAIISFNIVDTRIWQTVLDS